MCLTDNKVCPGVACYRLWGDTAGEIARQALGNHKSFVVFLLYFKVHTEAPARQKHVSANALIMHNITKDAYFACASSNMSH